MAKEMTPQEHYSVGLECLNLISEHKDDPDFDTQKAETLAASAQAHALLGLLRWKLSGLKF